MPYHAPLRDFQFLLYNVAGFGALSQTERFADASEDVVQAILTEAGRMCEEVIAPLRRVSDEQHAVLENGKLRSCPGFQEGYDAIAQGGWIATLASPEHGGLGLPLSLTTLVNEMIGSACLSLQLAPLMTQGQIEALEHHASDALKQLYLPKLVTGEWQGTMNLTEAQAGSDVGALRTKAERNDDGSYSITGQKVFISWGDSDLVENICHLVLARLPDGGPGTKGISLFLVPKFLPDDNGDPGAENSITTVSLEDKMGLHGSPTAVLQYDGSKGWLIGQEHDGMRCMFTMMNNARLGVGMQGISAAEGAYQHALAYAQERKQGRTPDVENGTGAIADHADVRRMLATMKADTIAARAIALANAVAIDMSTATGSSEWQARAAFLTPITKAFGTETGFNVSDMGIQVHGGMGYVEETGAAQFARDVRVCEIYEGTNGIQSMDLAGRKLMDEGEAAYALLDEMEELAEGARHLLPDLAEPVWQATESLREATEWMVAQKDMTDRFAGSAPFLRAWGRVLGGCYHLKAAMAEAEATGTYTKLARFYILRLLPEHSGLLAHATQGAGDLYALTTEGLAT